MFFKLLGNDKKIKEYNKWLMEFKENELKDTSLNDEMFSDYKEYLESLTEIKSLDEELCPYELFLKSIFDDGKKDTYYKVPDLENEDFTGFYVCYLNSEDMIERLTDFSIIEGERTYWYNYGIADNVSQIKSYINNLTEKGIFSNEKNYICLMTPFFKNNEEDGGFRWHKWGPYIGVQNHSHEYLKDEEGTELIYRFHVYEVLN